MLEIRHSEDNVAMDNMDDAIQRSGMSYKFIVSAMNNLHSHCHTRHHSYVVASLSVPVNISTRQYR